MNALAAYFPATGTTAQAASAPAKTAGADLYEIKPAVSYTDAGPNWIDKRSRSSAQIDDKHSLPALGIQPAPYILLCAIMAICSGNVLYAPLRDGIENRQQILALFGQRVFYPGWDLVVLLPVYQPVHFQFF